MSDVSRWLSQHATDLMEPAIAAAVVAATVALAVTGAGWWLGRRVLRARATVELRPSRAFDPSPEEVRRAASRLAHVRRRRSPVPPRASFLRVSLLTGADGLVRYQLSGPARSASALQLAGMAEVETRHSDDEETPTMAPWRTEPDSTHSDVERGPGLDHRSGIINPAARDQSLPPTAALTPPEFAEQMPAG